MIIHHYHPDTGLYLCRGEARPDPMDRGAFIIPAFATPLAPPLASAEEEIIWQGDDWIARKLAAPPPKPAPEPLTGAARITAIKAEAGRRILLIAPEWKQANLTARAAELALLYPNLKGEDLPEPERSEYRAGQMLWDRIKAIRAASNALENSEVEDIHDNSHWPE